MRAVTGMQMRQPERFQGFIDCLFRAHWVEGHDLGDSEVVGEGLTEAGFNPDKVLVLANDESVKAALKDNTEQAVQRGVSGAPSMFVGNPLFFGQDRLDFVRETLNQSRSNSRCTQLQPLQRRTVE